MSQIIGRQQTNPLEVLNSHLGDVVTQLKALNEGSRDHHYMLVTAEEDDGQRSWLIACWACSTAAGAAIHPCREGLAGHPEPPPGITVTAQADGN